MQDYDVTLNPGESRIINVQADYIYYRAGSAGGADAAIEFAPRSGGESVFLYPGQSYRAPQVGTDWVLKNRKGEAKIIGAILMGQGAFQDNRISGSVEVIDGARNRTIANQSFMGTTYVNALAAQYPAIMLWNPQASGKRLLIERVRRQSNQAGNLGLVFRNAAGATLDKNVQSKLSGGATSVAELRYESKASLVGSALASEATPAGTERERAFVVPLVVMPGYGLELWCDVAQSNILGSFEFIEENL